MDLFEEIFNNNTLYFDCLDRLQEAIYVYNTKKELLYLNKAAERRDGFTLNQAKGKTIYELYDFVHGLDEKYSPTLITLETEQPLYNHELSYFANGKKIVQICDSSPIYSNGKLVGVYVIQQDLTSIKDIVEQNIFFQKELGQQKSRLSPERPAEDAFAKLIGESKAFETCKDLAKQVAKTDSSVLLVGNTGSGKEVFARAIHEHSNRSEGTFLALNCAAIPESLIEGILFGTAKGVYTGATEKEGLLTQANGGTLFLDEINSMPPSSQAKLLRVLEEKRIMKLGSGKETAIDVRIISSTNESPGEAIGGGRLREDLFYRLSVVQITIPPLRERKEDIPALTQYFIQRYNQRFGKNVLGIEEKVMAYFMDFSWPGNVRQLKACVESAMNFAQDGENITLSELPPYVFENQSVSLDRYQRWQQIRYFNAPPQLPQKEAFEIQEKTRAATAHTKLKNALWEEEKNEIMTALHRSKGNISQAARSLGISKQLLFYRMKKYRLR